LPLLLLLLQVREELASWQDQLAAATAKSAAAEAALLAAQPEIEELQHRVKELQQGNGRLKEQLASQVRTGPGQGTAQGMVRVNQQDHSL